MILLENEVEPIDKFLLRRVFRENSILEYWATRSKNKNEINSSTSIYKTIVKTNEQISIYYSNFNYTIYGFKF